MQFLNLMKILVVTMSKENSIMIKWWVDSSYGVFPYIKSHTGVMMSFGQGSVYSTSRGKNSNTERSTK